MRAGAIYKTADLSKVRAVSVSKDSDLELNVGPGEILIEIALDHSVLVEPDWWFINVSGELARRTTPPPTPPREKRVQVRKLVQLILDEFNILRALHGLPLRTMQQVLDQIEE